MSDNNKYDLEERTTAFAYKVRQILKNVSKTVTNLDDIKQVIRSSGSIGANYMEANDGISEKDTKYRIKICRKEAKETKYWLTIIDVSEEEQKEIDLLKTEADELMRIFGAILKKIK